MRTVTTAQLSTLGGLTLKMSMSKWEVRMLNITLDGGSVADKVLNNEDFALTPQPLKRTMKLPLKGWQSISLSTV